MSMDPNRKLPDTPKVAPWRPREAYRKALDEIGERAQQMQSLSDLNFPRPRLGKRPRTIGGDS